MHRSVLMQRQIDAVALCFVIQMADGTAFGCGDIDHQGHMPVGQC